jgi:hypothetical protein
MTVGTFENLVAVYHRYLQKLVPCPSLIAEPVNQLPVLGIDGYISLRILGYYDVQ